MADMEKRGGYMGSPSTSGTWGEGKNGTGRWKLPGAPRSWVPVPVTALPFLGLDFLYYEMGMLTGRAE